MEATFISNELEGVFLIVAIGSVILAALGLWSVIEVLTGLRPIEEFVHGLGTFIFFSIMVRFSTRRL